jgi:hypothetical protein
MILLEEIICYSNRIIRRENMYKLVRFVMTIVFILIVNSAFAECPPGYSVDCGDGTCCSSGTYCCSGGCCPSGTVDCGDGTFCQSGSYCCGNQECCPTGSTDPCPASLSCMTYFCGGTDKNPYVCCPPGAPYLNHCDCQCYPTTDFDCGSYSQCYPK